MELTDLVQMILTIGLTFFVLGFLMHGTIMRLFRFLKVYLGSPKYLQAEKPFKPKQHSSRK